VAAASPESASGGRWRAGGAAQHSWKTHRSLFSNVHGNSIENGNFRGKMPLPLFKITRMFKIKADG
jgi:hypothetical protein